MGKDRTPAKKKSFLKNRRKASEKERKKEIQRESTPFPPSFPPVSFPKTRREPQPWDFSTPQPGENLARLYEMSDSPERRAWLDKLLAFMDDNKTPITACPTISKNPLDLYALYLHVRERGGFVEVSGKSFEPVLFVETSGEG